MYDPNRVPERIAMPVIDDLYKAADGQIAPRSPRELSPEEQENVMLAVAEEYNAQQTRFDASVRKLARCACGQCPNVGFGVRYRTYH